MEASTSIAAACASYGYAPLPGGMAETLKCFDPLIMRTLEVAKTGARYDSRGNLESWSVGNMTTADLGGAVISGASAYLSKGVGVWADGQYVMNSEHFVSNFGIALGAEFLRRGIGATAAYAHQQIR